MLLWDLTIVQELTVLHKVANGGQNPFQSSEKTFDPEPLYEAGSGSMPLPSGPDYGSIRIPMRLLGMRFSPDGSRILVAFEDRTLQMANAITGEWLVTWPEFRNAKRIRVGVHYREH